MKSICMIFIGGVIHTVQELNIGSPSIIFFIFDAMMASCVNPMVERRRSIAGRIATHHAEINDMENTVMRPAAIMYCANSAAVMMSAVMVITLPACIIVCPREATKRRVLRDAFFVTFQAARNASRA